jgi:hypothetical protein
MAKIYESVETLADFQTGEVKTIKTVVSKKVSREKFIKVYLEDISGILGITSQTEFKVLYKLWQLADWGTNQVLIYKEVKEQIGLEVGKSYSGVSNAVASLVKKGILKSVGRMKYMLNPKLFFKGEEIEKSSIIEAYMRYEIQTEEDEQQEVQSYSKG